MKIKPIVVNIMLAKKLGGLEQAFTDYIKIYNKLGYKSACIISKDAQIKSLIPHGTRIEYLSNFFEFDIFAAMRLKKILNTISPIAIIVHGRRASTLTRLANTKIKTIGVTHNYSIKHLLKLDRVIATTQDLRNKLLNSGYAKEKITLIPNTIEIPKNIRHKKFKQISKVPVIGAMGRFVQNKGFDLLVSALKILHDNGIEFKAVIAGQGPDEEKLKTMIRESGLSKKIEIKDWIKDKKKFFDSIDIYCLSSVHEPFGIVLLEAFIHSKPVVAFKSEGPGEIAKHMHNIVFASDMSAGAMADSLKKMIKNHKLAERISHNGFKTALKYDRENHLDAFDRAIL